MRDLEFARKEHRHALIQLSIARQMWSQAHPNHCTTCEGSGKVGEGEDCSCLDQQINPLDISQCGVEVDWVRAFSLYCWMENLGQYVHQEQEARSDYYSARLEYEREQTEYKNQWV
jgi:hypothetical protein